MRMDDSPQKATPPRRVSRFRWLRFSLRTLFILVTLFAAWLGLKVHQARRQQAGVKAIQELGGWVYYDVQFIEGGGARPDVDLSKVSSVPDWLLTRLGEDFFHDVAAIDMVAELFDLSADEVMPHLSAFPRLRRLLLMSAGGATDESLRAIGQLPNLEKLYIGRGPTVTDAGVLHLRKLHKLKSVELYSVNITDESLRVFGTMRQLEGLYLSGVEETHITDTGLEHLHGMKKLRTLSLGGGNKVTDEGVRKIQDAIPGLWVHKQRSKERRARRRRAGRIMWAE
jgi:hypothetical protein